MKAMFEHIVGNSQVKEYLKRMVDKRAIGNSLLFAGPDGIGKNLFAEAFAKLLICQDDPHGTHRLKIDANNHPDIRVYRPEGKIGMHNIASMRQFNEEVYQSPFEAKWKVFIVHAADRMLSYSANALLKTFEEPPHDAVIILLSSAPSALLPTVLSRCRKIYFQPLSENEIETVLVQHHGKSPDEARAVAPIAHGSVSHALRMLREQGSSLRPLLLGALARGKVKTYKELTAITDAIADHIEVAKKKIEEESRAMLAVAAGENLSAVQKQSLEKEIEGLVSIYGIQEAHSLFSIILGWYRDLQLLKVSDHVAFQSDLLIHKDYASTYLSNSQAYEFVPLEKVQKFIEEARLSLERSTSVNICFENIFLKLNLL